MHTSPYAQAAPCDVIYPEFSRVTETLLEDMSAISREDIVGWIVNGLSECTGVDPQDIEVHQPCSAYGLDSLAGVTLTGDLELWLNVRLSPTLHWDMPSIDQLVWYLVDVLDATPDDAANANEPEQGSIVGMSLDPETARQLLPQLAHLSDQDVEAMLDQLAA